MELRKQLHMSDKDQRRVYEHLKSLQVKKPINIKIQNQIMLDLKRTRSPITGKIHTQGECELLSQVLQTIAFLIPDMGYCQGMNYVVSSLYSDIKDEELTFNIFLSLLYNKSLKPLYSNNVPEYHVRCFILDQLIKEHIHDLFLYFKRIGLNPEVITGQWLMTFFCGYFNYPSILSIIDNFFLDDWVAVFRIALALL